MTNEKKQVEVKEGFRVSNTIGSYYETRYGWSGSVCENTSLEQFVDCFDDAKNDGLGYVELEFYVQDFNEIWLFLTFAPNPKRGRMSLELLKDEDNFSDFFEGVMGFIVYDLRPINADTSRAMKRLYDGERYHDDELHHEATELSCRLDEIARSWVECMKGTTSPDDMQRVVDNSTAEKCEMTKWGEIVEDILKRENA